ncbi:hypothetical protein HY745_02130 [Candidatus Desantisbacteria bacterium]|nr:hypothetical protein [Candidatus Desantisbacteria bacterium]
MKTAEYTGTILSDGHIDIPKNIRKELKLQKNSMVRVTLVKEEDNKLPDDFLKLFGTWEDERGADEIIREIYGMRISSRREIKL